MEASCFGSVSPEIRAIFSDLDSGKQRICTLEKGAWIVHEDLKKAVCSCFSQATCALLSAGTYDKIPLKFAGWTQADFENAGIRVVSGAVVRYGAFLARNVVLMNCFVNVGAYVDSKTLIDSFTLVGACAQVGKNCHISAHVVLGGVLEPLNARPVIIEDDCFVGAHCSVVEGVRVRRGATLAMGTHLGASTKIIDRQTGQVFQGEIPEEALVVPGVYAEGEPEKGNNARANVSVQCAIIVRYGKAHQDLSLNQDLRHKE
ncbi:2,3,4,5-tetrahydropyridine-2,6-dicarboxylate N-succinyltransferase [Alphaproteobacteria bacterium]|nr:2,3,4,5-tetrahydropyridine-2,6-dicarboxylate N-succinyltransferase [Alphaproteobacteria bacterium]GHS99582.1 2,3,4,5-tetrahydropyridine-2,6-dicarboxylate N-succinyltransferase [Alphaproteobacteria bacterium]